MKLAAVRLLCFCMALSAISACRSLRSNPLAQDAGPDNSVTGGGGADAAVDLNAAGQDRPGPMGDGPTVVVGDGPTVVVGDGPTVVVNGKQDNGKACSGEGDCQSGFCRDGVCCNEACGGTCKACAAAYTGGADGVCANVMAGASVRGACPDETMTKPCGHDGTCDGAGQCKTVAAGHTCGEATCTDAHTFQAASMCDGSGACVEGAAMDCGTYPCATTGCAKPCTAATDCAAGQYCASGTCKVKKSAGISCAAASECGSGFCSPDQVCCDKACTGACTACLKAITGQSDGTCAPVQVGQDPRNDCEMEVATSCGKDGTCDGKGGCHLYASGMSCAAGTCSGSMFTPGKTCNGSGMCSGSGSPTDCGQNACATTGCTTACKLDGECGSTGYCDQTAAKCAAKKSNGSPCGGGGECSSGACVENICCNTACTGACLACSAAKTGGANGTCAFIKAGTPDSQCTASDKTTCGQNGNCDGSGKCEKWPSSTACGAGSCSSGNYLAERMCSGQGVCSPAAQMACGGALCDAATGCRTTCTTAADCTGNNYCDLTTHKCTPLKANGGSCGTDGKQCMSGFCVDGVCCNTGQCGSQCQSCSTGTCKSVTTARTPCPGSGACVGTCDGTSPTCTFKGTSVNCSPAGCQGSDQMLAATCDGRGSCSDAVIQPCPGGGTCSGAAICLHKNGDSCTVASECSSGVCKTYYPDMDSDGYPTQSGALFCGPTPPPGSHYIPARSDGKWDCCDLSGETHPGATAPTSGSWPTGDPLCTAHLGDNNCDGTVQYAAQIVVSCVDSGTSCDSKIATPVPSFCGTTFQICDCGRDPVSSMCFLDCVADTVFGCL